MGLIEKREAEAVALEQIAFFADHAKTGPDVAVWARQLAELLRNQNKWDQMPHRG